MPRFNVSVTQTGSSDRWYVFDQRAVSITITAQSQGVDVNDYKFFLYLDESNTGFNRLTGKYDCGAELFELGVGGGPYTATLIRCGMGLPDNTGFELRARLASEPIGSSHYPVGNSGEIELAWHRRDSKVRYEISLTTLKGTKPNYLTSPFQYLLDSEAAIRDAAVTWNNMTGKAIFEESSLDSTLIEGYWHGSPLGCKGNTRFFACEIRAQPVADYPHMASSTLQFAFPPYGQGSEWTNLIGRAKYQLLPGQRRYVYMPAVAIHEFGHAAGMADVYHVIGEIMMGRYRWGNPITVPKLFEVKAVASLGTVHHGGGGF